MRHTPMILNQVITIIDIQLGEGVVIVIELTKNIVMGRNKRGITMEKIANITSESNEKNVILTDTVTTEIVPFYRSKDLLTNTVNYVKFIKNVEAQVRSSKEYSAYIKYLKTELDPPLSHCMVMSNITDDHAPIEMHHMILTLFDIVEIIATWHFKNDKPFSSSRIFHCVMEEHRANRILVVMLCEAVHKACHNQSNPKFIDYRMGHGDIVAFLEKYWDCLSLTHIKKIQVYLESHKKYTNEEPNSFFEEVITKWTNEV